MTRKKRKINKDKLRWIILSVFVCLVIVVFCISIRKTNRMISNLISSQLSLQKGLLLQLDEYKPLRRWKVEGLNIQAKSALSILVDKNYKNQKILFQKNTDQKLGIASLTKLMTTFVALKEYNLNRKIKFSQQDVDTEGIIGYFKPGEIFLFKDLIYSLLCESSNDAASAVSHSSDNDKFILNMNIEAHDLGLKNTFFVNSTGLTEDDGKFNYSTANDLARLIISILRDSEKDKGAQLILKATGTKRFNLFTVSGKFHHKILSTDKLLYLNDDVVNGKTGWTPLAQGCLVIVSKSPNNKGYLINVILGSPERFKEMEKLINWDKEAYYW